MRTGNIALDNGDLIAAADGYRSVSSMLSVLGIADDMRDAATDHSAQTTIAALVDTMLAQRTRARDARDFATADRIREELADAGIVIDDTAAGTQWRRK